MSNATIQNCSGGLYRCSVTLTPSGSTNCLWQSNVLDSSYSSGNPGSYSFLGDGTSGITVFNVGVQAGAFVTSAILTTQATGNLTRSADVVSTTDATLLSAKGWVVEVGELPGSVASTILGINTGIGLGATSGNALTTADGGTQTTGNTGTWTGLNRAGLAFDSTPRVSIDLDGGTITTAANTPVTPTTIYFGSTNGASAFLNGHIRKWASYATITDAQLVSVSSVGASFGNVANVGSSTGANASAAVGAWLQSGAGSSTGTNASAAVGAWLQAGVGSSAGANTSSATAAPIQAKVGSAAGANTATAIGAWLQAGVAASAGANTSSATGKWLQSGVGNAAGANTTTGYSASVPGVFTSSGANTATAVGAWIQASVGSSAGSNTVSGVGTGVRQGVASSAGTNVTSSFGSWLQAGIGTSVGTNTSIAFPSTFVISGVGTSVGEQYCGSCLLDRAVL